MDLYDQMVAAHKYWASLQWMVTTTESRPTLETENINERVKAWSLYVLTRDAYEESQKCSKQAH